MSIWTDRIKEHTIWDSLKALGLSIDACVSTSTELSADDVAGLERLRSILAFTGKRLAATDAFMLNDVTLDALESNLLAMTENLNSFLEDNDSDHILSANEDADKSLIQIASILTPLPADDLSIINSSLTEYRETMDVYLQQAQAKEVELRDLIGENEAAIQAQAEKLSEEQARLALLLADYQSQFSSNQDSRASDYAAITSEFQTQFATAQIAIQEKVGAIITSSTEKLNAQQSRFSNQQEKANKAYKDDLAKLRFDYEGQAKILLDEIVVHRGEVEQLVGVIGNLGVTSGYLNEANTARNTQYVWQALTVIALGGLIGVAYLMAFPPEIHEIAKAAGNIAAVGAPDNVKAAAATTAIAKETLTNSSAFLFYQGLATRIFLSITFGVFAAYSATQAEKYMEMDRRNRKLALELAAVGPYISPLPLEMQNKFRADLGEKSFGVAEPVKKNHKDPVTALDIFKSKEIEGLLGKILEIVKRDKTPEH